MTSPLTRSLNDLGLAAWFGGSLMGAVGLNGAAAQAEDPTERVRLATVGWHRWSPVQTLAMGTHIAAGAVLFADNSGRVVAQSGVGRTAGLKAILTGVAVASTAYAGLLSRGLRRKVGAAGATEPSGDTLPEVARRQRRLRRVQWVTPLVLAGVIVADAQLGEQQRPGAVASGVLDRVRPG